MRGCLVVMNRLLHEVNLPPSRGRWSSLNGVDSNGIRAYLHHSDSIPEDYVALKRALAAAGTTPEYQEQQYKGPPPHSISIEICHNPI